MKKFEIPAYYRSSITGRIKEFRRQQDLRKQDFTPTLLDFGPVRFVLARHFGFCYGVENAIEISYRAIEENPGKRIYLLSQMIHNQEVNRDLQERGVRFIMDTDGSHFIPWSDLTPDDIVIIPAFGTTLEIENRLGQIGVDVQRYNTTCPFVEKVWNRSEKLGKEHHTIIIHGKPNHEETRATFSHSASNAPSVIVRDQEDAKHLGEYILGNRSREAFFEEFAGKYSEGFDPALHLTCVGVVNQTTMLASETQGIADYIRQLMIQRYGLDALRQHFADTRDTLCYATNDNQDATYELLKAEGDFAIVVGGYNSSNTSHIVELCERKFPTYFINSASEIKSQQVIDHFDYHAKERKTKVGFIPDKTPVTIVVTSGASCPDTLVDQVILKVLGYFEHTSSLDTVLGAYTQKQ
ncbi:MAG TPA: 4-hydroxy-3-methylbut-2-enyl diphosphate reductase [Cyclobacteriaceae bacterium]|nr:4-hydroxy-3-methylbut-2-enyl diphosphate reductase [Cyclobacteriaceae bacterium]